MYEFEYLWAFLLLPAPLLAWWFLPPYHERRAAVRVPFFERIASAVGVEPRGGGAIQKKSLAQNVLAPICWVLIVTALARPQIVEPPIERSESARDLVLAVDLSGSMDTRDMRDADGTQIDRLEAVKRVLDDFIARRKGDRIGLIVFGNQTFLQAPFTQDHDLVRALLERTKPRMAGPQTMIGDAIGLGIKVFENSQAPDRVLILLTDGNDSGSKVPPIKASEIAGSRNVTVHTIAVGDPESVGENRMDVETLSEIAANTGGESFLALNREELEAIYRRIDELEPTEIETTSFRPTRPLFHWPLGAAMTLVFLYHLLVALGQARRLAGGRHHA